MKKILHSIFSVFTAAVFCAVMVPVQPAFAADLSYTSLVGTGDNALTIDHKKAVVEVNGNSSVNITTATTTAVKSGSGVLVRIVVNTAGASTPVLTIYDNTSGSGTKLGTVSAAAQTSLTYDVRFATGLTIVSTGGTPADVTVVYR